MRKILLLTGIVFSFSAVAKIPDCGHSWPMNMTEGWLKNEKVVDITQLDEPKTKVKLLASEKKSGGLYTQIYHYTFYDKSGKSYEIITQSDSSLEECSMSEVNIFQVAKSSINH